MGTRSTSASPAGRREAVYTVPSTRPVGNETVSSSKRDPRGWAWRARVVPSWVHARKPFTRGRSSNRKRPVASVFPSSTTSRQGRRRNSTRTPARPSPCSFLTRPESSRSPRMSDPPADEVRARPSTFASRSESPLERPLPRGSVSSGGSPPSTALTPESEREAPSLCWNSSQVRVAAPQSRIAKRSKRVDMPRSGEVSVGSRGYSPSSRNRSR